MSQLHVASEVTPASWNESLRALHGTIFHTVGWANSVVAEQAGVRPDFYTLLDDDDSVVGMAVGFRASSSRSMTAAFSRRRWLDALPAMRDRSASEVSRFVRLIERDSQLAGDVTFRVGSFASPGGEPVLRSLGYSIAHRLEFELDLTKDEKSLWEGVDIKRRQRIKKAMKASIEVKELLGSRFRFGGRERTAMPKGKHETIPAVTFATPSRSAVVEAVYPRPAMPSQSQGCLR